MNKVIYKDLEFGLVKKLVYICLFEKTISIQILSLGSVIKQTKFKHNNVFMSKHVNIRA